MLLPRPSLACDRQLPPADAIAFDFALARGLPIRADQDPDLIRPRPARPPVLDDRMNEPKFPWPWLFIIVFFTALAIYGITQS